jgi:metal-responsive CopG/Arc/MetJ family transcriptional regulator
MGKRAIYIKLDEELVEEIDRLRRTQIGEIDRSDYIANILKKYIDEVKASVRQ